MQDGNDRDSRDLRSGFVQADLEAVPRRLQITGGVKLEHQDRLGLEAQPSARFLWRIGPGQAVWGAISRALRTPSIVEQRLDLWVATIPGGGPMDPRPLPVAVRAKGRTTFASEVLVAWEAGSRCRPTDALLFDAAVFLMKYDRVRGFDIGDTSIVMSPLPHVSIPLVVTNLNAGDTRGFELLSDWYARRWLRLRASYSYLDMRQTRGGTVDDNGMAGELGAITDVWRSSSSHQARLWASLGLGRAWDLDISGRYVSALPAQSVPAYAVLDARLAWRPSPPLEISVTGRNLGPASHEEFFAEFFPTTAAIRPAFYTAVALSW
jgi:iron complex outermembrane receptor protein